MVTSETCCLNEADPALTTRVVIVTPEVLEPGHSGAPIVDASTARVVAIADGGVIGVGVLGFAIPLEDLALQDTIQARAQLLAVAEEPTGSVCSRSRRRPSTPTRFGRQASSLPASADRRSMLAGAHARFPITIVHQRVEVVRRNRNSNDERTAVATDPTGHSGGAGRNSDHSDNDRCGPRVVSAKSSPQAHLIRLFPCLRLRCQIAVKRVSAPTLV